MSSVNRDVNVPLTTQQAKRVESTSPALRNVALAQRVAKLEQNDVTSDADITALQSDVNTLQAETASLLPTGQIRVPVSLVANSTWSTYVPAPKYGATVTAVKLVTPTAFASTGGAVTLEVRKNSSTGNTLLSAATFDLESIPADTLLALALTSTAGDKVLTGADMVYLEVASDNADATGPADAAACAVIEFTYTID